MSKVQEVFYKVNAAVISTQWVSFELVMGDYFDDHFVVINYSLQLIVSLEEGY